MNTGTPPLVILWYMANNDRTDRSLLQPGIPTGIQGFQIILNGLKDGTVEMKNLLNYECDVIIECRFCHNLFRSLDNFVAHKKVYCKGSVVEERSRNLEDIEKTELFKADKQSVNSDDDEENDKFEENISEKSFDFDKETKPNDKTACDEGGTKIKKKCNQKSLTIIKDKKEENVKNKSKTIRQQRELSKLKWTVLNNKKVSQLSNVTSKSDEMESSKPKRMKLKLEQPFLTSSNVTSSFHSPLSKLTQKKQEEIVSSPEEIKKSASNKDNKFPVIFSEKEKEQLLQIMNEKELLCKQCGAKFSLRCNLQHHCYMHLGFIRFKCSSCNYGSFFQYDVRNHVMSTCGYVKRNERKTFNKSKLDSFIVPACAEEPGRVVIQKSATNKKKKSVRRGRPRKLVDQASPRKQLSSSSKLIVTTNKNENDDQKLLSDKCLKEGRVSDQSKCSRNENGETTYDKELNLCTDNVLQKVSSIDEKKVMEIVTKIFNSIEAETNMGRESSKNCEENSEKLHRKNPFENEEKVKQKTDNSFSIDMMHEMELGKCTVSESKKDVGKKLEAAEPEVLNGDEVTTVIKQGQNLIQGVVTSAAHSSPLISPRLAFLIANMPTTDPSLKNKMLLNFDGKEKEVTTTTGVLKSSAKAYRGADRK